MIILVGGNNSLCHRNPKLVISLILTQLMIKALSYLSVLVLTRLSMYPWIHPKDTDFAKIIVLNALKYAWV